MGTVGPGGLRERKLALRGRRTGKQAIRATNDTILVLVKFEIRGNLRFLSHAETVKVLQRACVRAGMEVQHSEGFNPRPRLSLPLPRPVGVESDDELLALVAGCRDDRMLADLPEQIKAGLRAELPRGCEVVSVGAARGGNAPQPCSATYVFAVRPDYVNDELSNRIKHLLASDTLIVRRQTDAKASRFKDVDVRGFLRSVELKDGCVSVECEISLAGSVRVEEILELLGLDVEKLDRPIKRTMVQWRSS